MRDATDADGCRPIPESVRNPLETDAAAPLRGAADVTVRIGADDGFRGSDYAAVCRATAWLATISAVEGWNARDVARELRDGFGLGRSEAWALVEAWNAARGQPTPRRYLAMAFDTEYPEQHS